MNEVDSLGFIVVEAEGHGSWTFSPEDIKSIVNQAVILAKENIPFKLVKKTVVVEFADLAKFK